MPLWLCYKHDKRPTMAVFPCSFLYIHVSVETAAIAHFHSANQNALQTPTGHMTVFPVLFLEYTRVEGT